MNRKKIIGIVIVLTLIIGLLAFFEFGRSNKALIQYDVSDLPIELAHNPDMAISGELVNEKYKDVPSDIEGMTKYDKAQKGLDPRDGSDTDYDGLTDKEEIEVYHTDPLKTSTSGDLYSDGYKVANNLDLNEYYEDGKVLFNNLPEELHLHARYASDNRATVGSISYKGTGAYDGFMLSKFAGDGLVYDLTQIKSDNGVEYDEVGAIVMDYSTKEFAKCDYETVDNYLKIKCDFDSSKGYDIYIINKELIPSRLSRFIFGDSISEEFNRLAEANAFSYYMGHDRDEAEGLVVTPLPILTIFDADEQLSVCRPRIYYNETEDQEQNDELLARLTKLAEHFSRKGVKTTSKGTNIVDIVNFYNKLEAIGGGFFNAKHNSVFHNGLFEYALLSEIEALSPDENKKPRSYEGMVEDFDIVADTLPFRNFGSALSPRGNCMGISTLIAKLSNKGSNPSSGISKSEPIANQNKPIEWDISKDPQNKTITDPILNDYKDTDFAKDVLYTENGTLKSHKMLDGNLSEGEEEFVKMIGAYFYDGNEAINAKDDEGDWICPFLYTDGYEMYSLSKLRDVCKKYLNSKVLILNMKSGEYGHAVNIYGYEDRIETDGVLYLYVYDNNFPGEKSKGLKVEITPSVLDGLDYSYSIPGADDYGYSSKAGKYMFVILDEDHNILFGTKDDLDHIPKPIDKAKTAEGILEQMDF